MRDIDIFFLQTHRFSPQKNRCGEKSLCKGCGEKILLLRGLLYSEMCYKNTVYIRRCSIRWSVSQTLSHFFPGKVLGSDSLGKRREEKKEKFFLTPRGGRTVHRCTERHPILTPNFFPRISNCCLRTAFLREKIAFPTKEVKNTK